MSDEWLTVIIVLLIVGIVLDGIRRVRAARRERIVMSNNLPDSDDFQEDDVVGSEFPSGGARVAGYRHPDDATAAPVVEAPVVRAPVVNTARSSQRGNRKPEPMIMETVPSGEPSLGDYGDLDDDLAVAEDVGVATRSRMRQKGKAAARSNTKPRANTQSPASAQPVSNAQASSGEQSRGRQPSSAHSSSAQSSSTQPSSTQSRANTKKSPTKKPSKAAAAQDKRTSYLEPQEVIVINVMASAGHAFPGAELLHVLTEQNLRWGDMEIFHRHKGEGGSGEILFSLANIVKPGTFDLNTMEHFSSPGISMFMTLPIRGDSVAAFGLMARTAKAIAEALGGELKDENRSVMTQQTFEHCRQRVIEFERKRRLAR